MTKTSVGLSINQDLMLATVQALNQAEKELNANPSGILYFTGTHVGGRKIYNKAMKIIKKRNKNFYKYANIVKVELNPNVAIVKITYRYLQRVLKVLKSIPSNPIKITPMVVAVMPI